ncbi:hypothetical protein RhiirA5_442240 [Rhizophagus irregularis]|uniref:Uncharacterized protein n=1 Tax=Rhizophagus irregularis TaxID=588596 RepID=A0A2N0NF09_9GLOM|nr:hypothetical protein RhiirA5_442240 [Rhizophagus irregularis]
MLKEIDSIFQGDKMRPITKDNFYRLSYYEASSTHSSSGWMKILSQRRILFYVWWGLRLCPRRRLTTIGLVLFDGFIV